MLIIVEYLALFILFVFSSCAVAKTKYHCFSLPLFAHAMLGTFALSRSYLLGTFKVSGDQVFMVFEVIAAALVLIRFFLMYSNNKSIGRCSKSDDKQSNFFEQKGFKK